MPALSLRGLLGIGLLLAFAALGAWGQWQHTKRLQAEALNATLQAQVATLGRQVADQNAAVKEWQDRAEKAKARGEVALKHAQAISESIRPATVTLQAALTASAPPSSCPAGDGVREVRAALAGVASESAQ